MKTAAEYPKDDLLNIYRGAMAEQFVGQEMMVSQDSDFTTGRARPEAARRRWITLRSWTGTSEPLRSSAAWRES